DATLLFFFFPAPPTPCVSPISLHDALPICAAAGCAPRPRRSTLLHLAGGLGPAPPHPRRSRPRPLHRLDDRRPDVRQLAHPRRRSEEHTSELQSRENLVCRLLLAKKKKHLT